MSQAVVFFTAVGLLVLIVLFFPTAELSEGFQATQSCAAKQDAKLVKSATQQIEEKAVNPEIAQQGIGRIEPAIEKTAELPLQPVELRAKGAPLPYRDPSTEFARYIRIRGVMEDLKAFQAFEAQSLQDQCDPSIQLPLSTLKADLEKLQVAVSVMDRNPGVTSTITTRTLNDMVANLQFLRDKRNLLVANKVIEGFASATSTSNGRATLEEIREFDTKVTVEKLRLGASGTTDPNVIARVATLDKIHLDLQEIIDQVEEKVIDEQDIPVKKSDIERALPSLGDLSKPLPQAITQAGLPSWLLSLFPGGLSTSDTTTLNQFRKALGKYADTFFANLKSQQGQVKEAMKPVQRNFTEQFEAEGKRVTRDETFASMHGAMPDLTKTEPFAVYGEGRRALEVSGIPGYKNPQVKELSGLNWEERAKSIGERIEKRGLNPKEFGVLPKGSEVGLDFSWRGYARMICTRLAASTDPGLPEYVGCPPMHWKGWQD